MWRRLAKNHHSNNNSYVQIVHTQKKWGAKAYAHTHAEKFVLLNFYFWWYVQRVAMAICAVIFLSFVGSFVLCFMGVKGEPQPAKKEEE